MALSSTEPSLRVDEPLQNYQLDHTQQHHTESFTFDQANGAPHPGPVRAGRIDEGNLPHGQPELERQSQDVSPASSMGGSFTGGQEGREEGYSSRAQRKLDELRNLFKLPSDEVRSLTVLVSDWPRVLFVYASGPLEVAALCSSACCFGAMACASLQHCPGVGL